MIKLGQRKMKYNGIAYNYKTRLNAVKMSDKIFIRTEYLRLMLHVSYLQKQTNHHHN